MKTQTAIPPAIRSQEGEWHCTVTLGCWQHRAFGATREDAERRARDWLMAEARELVLST